MTKLNYFHKYLLTLVMFKKKIEGKNARPRILVAPLNWGLGHATRCIPVIKELINNGCEVLIAAEGPCFSLLQNEFPELRHLSIPAYNMHYSRRRSFFTLTILSQLPKLLLAICKEHSWLKKVVRKEGIDAVISDNRFGLYHRTIPSIYITHQLLIKTGNTFTEKIAQRIHYRFIKKYTACWVPDMEQEPSLAGKLSHPDKLPATIVNYIGCLSRFEKIPAIEKKYALLIIISGPEPQRTIFENIILQQLPLFNGTVLLLRGLPADLPVDNEQNDTVQIINHLSAAALNTAIQQAGIVISRSGYTTILDLVKLQQKAILVPTPGQTEQEYLAAHLSAQKIVYTLEQDNFLLNEALKDAERFSFAIPFYDMEQYKRTVREFVAQL